jgi:serine/threonine protein kinase
LFRTIFSNFFSTFFFSLVSTFRISSNEGHKEEKEKEREDQLKLTKGVGTLIYQAPELLQGSTSYLMDKADIYSYSMLLYQMFTGATPYTDDETKHLQSWGKFVQKKKKRNLKKKKVKVK